MNSEIGTVTVRTKRKIHLVDSFKKDILAWIMLLPSIVLFVVFVWQPLFSGVFLSFFETKGYEAVKFIGFGNFVDVIQDTVFLKALRNCFSYTIWSLMIGFLTPIVIAIIINEMVHLKSLFRFSVYFPSMVPGVATALMWYFMFDPGPGGLLNTIFDSIGLPQLQWLQNPSLTIPLIIITLTWRAFGGTVIIYIASLQGINQELYEAATLDGAGLWSRIKSITIPSISNIIGLMFIMQIISVFQIMADPLIMTEGGPDNASTSLMLQSYFYGFRYFQAGKSMAVGTITFVILMLLTAIYFKINKEKEVE